MRTLTLRPIVFVVLLFTFLSLGGATFAEAAVLPPVQTDSCCFPAGHDATLPQSPCATPDCPCLFCLNLHLLRFAGVFFLPLSSGEPVSHPLASPLAAFARPIDYPPEHS